MKTKISETKAFLLDLDGTVYLGDKLLGDVKNTLKSFRDKGITLVYLTNNSSKTDDEYLVKLKELGIWDDRDIFYSSLDAAIDYLKENYESAKVYPMATEKVKNHLINSGINVTEKADLVLATYDKELNYEKMV
jgi:ribonucleotide monophosphatase NagD (HAD superfamily)